MASGCSCASWCTVKSQREIARPRVEGPRDDAEAAVRDWTLAMASRSQALFPTAHDIVHEAVAIEERLRSARVAADAKSATVGPIGPESKSLGDPPEDPKTN